MKNPVSPVPIGAGMTLRLSAIVGAMIVALVLCLSLGSEAQAQQKKGPFPTSIDRRVLDLEKEVARLRSQIDIYETDHLPEIVMLCDKKIYLAKDDLRERFEREFFQLLENRGLMTILVKRYLKYQTMISDEIKKMGLPSDLIYLVVAESYLNPRALSKASAAGLWQFIKETGKREGLYIDEQVDERYNVKKATKSALVHLKKQYNEFGDWLVAMAAYNAGPNRLREAIENQETRDFFELFLPEETERYIFRILSIKEIIANRERYGYLLDERALYRPYLTAELTLDLSKDTHTNVLSKSMDVPYKTFRDLNLHIRKYRLSKGTVHIFVPYDKKSVFLQKIRAYPFISVLSENGASKD